MNSVHKMIERIGGKREAVERDAWWDYRRDVVKPALEIEGFVDATTLLHMGLYVLVLAGEVVYVGKTTAPMYAAIEARVGGKLSFIPRIEFDQVLIRRVHPDRLAAEYDRLVAEFPPKAAVRQSNPVPCERRV